MARNTHVIPDLYFPTAAEVCSASGQELQNSDSEEEGWQGLEAGPEQSERVDLSKEGFIPIHQLTLGDLPEPIRTELNFLLIMDLSKRVVRINNNRLSDKRRGDKDMMLKAKSLCGSGFFRKCALGVVEIVTNRHVLFNDEEMAKTTFDVFFDYKKEDANDKKKLFKRSRRGDGKLITKTTSKYDLSLATFLVSVDMMSHLSHHCRGLRQMPDLWHHNQKQDSRKSLSSVPRPTVCLISHPLKQAKQVSFGQALDYDPLTRILHHNAPSREGSSGAPVLVFTTQSAPKLDRCLIYHVGTDLKTGSKIAQVEIQDYLCLEKDQTYYDFKGNKHSGCFDTLSDDGFEAKADASLQVATLAACAPAMGAFLLLAEDSHLSALDKDLLKPCKAFHSDEPTSSHTLKPFVKEVICKLAQVVPAFSLAPSSNPDDVPELDTLLESQGPCFCRSIVKLMESSSKSDCLIAAEAFLSPYTMTVKMLEDSDVTWPWLTRDGSAPICQDKEEEECLLRKCLLNCEHLDGTTIQVIMLHLILKANAVVRHLFPRHCDAHLIPASGKEERNLETTCNQKVSSCGEKAERSPDIISPARKGATTCPVAPLKENWLGFAWDVVALVCFVLRFSLGRCEENYLTSQKEFPVENGEKSKHLEELFSLCLARSQHVVRHRKQVHPDRGRPGQEDCDTEPCPCGRPTFLGVIQAMNKLRYDVLDALYRESNKGIMRLRTHEDIEAFKRKSSLNFYEILKDLSKAVNRSYLMKLNDRMTLFTQDPESLMLSLASTEAILYNSCMFARYISKHLQPLYIASPVSVFGRPGNWPGNVTPPEVQRTAWRLIQDAIMASGFRPAMLVDLEKDAERRSKLIDVYVDMKQLKWEKKILPHQFEKILAKKEDLSGVDIIRNGGSFRSATRYFVCTVYYLMGFGKIVFE